MRLLILLLVFLSLFDLKCIRLFEIIWDGETINKPNPAAISLSDEENPHKEEEKKLIDFFVSLQDLSVTDKFKDKKDKVASKNIAFYSLSLDFPKKDETFQIEMKGSNYLFLSGSDPEVCKAITDKTKKSFFCISSKEYLAPETKRGDNHKPNEHPRSVNAKLRKYIADFFSFNTDTGSLERTANEFKNLIGISDFFSEIRLTPIALENLRDAFVETLQFRSFDQASDERAKELGLYDKYYKDQPLNHIDDLFGDSVTLQFGDSEQTMIMQILKELEKKEGSISIVVKEELLSDLIKICDWENINKKYYEYANLKKKKEKISKKREKSDKYDNFKEDWEEILTKLKNSEKELEDIEKKAIPETIEWWKNNVRVTINVYSIYDMCKNCQGTFAHLFQKGQEIKNKLLAASAYYLEKQKKISSSMLSCHNGWIYRNTDTINDIPFFELPMTLRVYSIKQYI